jgi:cyclopropane fatty-acyl-phospholipid synthase-like methyltransferase
MEKAQFETFYQDRPPWDIPGPQPAFVALEEAGAIDGSVLDAGCGTGENALYLAARGHEVWGVDFVESAIERASAKAKERGLDAHFQVSDALKLAEVHREFDSIIDCGLFHTFGDEERVAYAKGLAAVLRPGGRYFMLCFSDREPPGVGPRRVTQQEIRDSFRDGWEVEEICDSRFDVTDHPEVRNFTPGGPLAWLATIVRRAASQ